MAVTIFKHSNFRGTNTTLEPGKYPTIPRVGNDNISSVKVAPGFFAKLYVHSGFRGRSVILFPGHYSNVSGFNDEFSSIDVNEYDAELFPSVRFFQHANFKGYEQRLAGTGQVTDYDFPFVQNDAISSVKVPEGTKVILYKDSRLRGSSLTLEAGDHPSLGVFGFNDKVSSVQIIQNDLELVDIEYTNFVAVEGEPKLIKANTQNGSDIDQKANLLLEATYSETFSRSFSNSTLFGLEISTTASVGIEKGPLSASLSTTITKKFENTFTVGKEESKSNSITIAKELNVTIPPRTLAEAIMTLTPVKTTVDAIYTFQLVGTDKTFKQNVTIEVDDAAVGVAEIKAFRPIL